jgi:hypothetical protein
VCLSERVYKGPKGVSVVFVVNQIISKPDRNIGKQNNLPSSPSLILYQGDTEDNKEAAVDVATAVAVDAVAEEATIIPVQVLLRGQAYAVLSQETSSTTDRRRQQI